MLDVSAYLFALAVMICTTALLALGVFIGFLLGRWSKAVATEVIIRPLAMELNRCLEQSESGAHSEQILQAIQSVTRAVNQLSAMVRPALETTSGIDHKLETVTEESEMSKQLSTDELKEFTADQYEAASDTHVQQRRYSYDCKQWVLPWQGRDEINREGIEVRCHDISGAGISFLFPEEPAFASLAITLGSLETRILMAAKVAFTKAVYMHGEHQVLVGCEFVARLGSFTISQTEGTLCAAR